jgi:hypothetical protein
MHKREQESSISYKENLYALGIFEGQRREENVVGRRRT